MDIIKIKRFSKSGVTVYLKIYYLLFLVILYKNQWEQFQSPHMV